MASHQEEDLAPYSYWDVDDPPSAAGLALLDHQALYLLEHSFVAVVATAVEKVVFQDPSWMGNVEFLLTWD